jgi:hypothetical protein
LPRCREAPPPRFAVASGQSTRCWLWEAPVGLPNGVPRAFAGESAPPGGEA